MNKSNTMKQIITLTAIVFACSYGFGQIPTANLVAYYPFNGNALDESTNSNDATLNGVTLATDRFGNQNSAYDFDGVDDFMTVAHDNSINFDGYIESYSFSFWVNSSSPKLSDLAFRLFEKRETGLGTEPYPVIIGGVLGTGDYSSQYVVFDGNPPSTNFTSSGTEWDGAWHHIAFVVNNNSFDLKIYVDANLIGMVPLNLTASTANPSDLLIGTNYNNLNFYHGLMDDIRIYEDALTECEIFALYLEDNPTLFMSENVALCEGSDYTFPDGNQMTDINADMTYTSYFPSLVNGCDSASVETNIFVTLVDETVTLTDLTLTSNVSTGATYQWIDCDNNMSAIIGETSQSYTVVANGNYALAITQSGCTDTSSCVNIDFVGLDEINSLISVYPNPSDHIVTLEVSNDLIGNSFSVMDFAGRVILKDEIESPIEAISLGQYGTGIYYISIDNEAIRKRIVIN